MQVVTIIQARMSSTRLPKKALLPIAGKPMLQHVVDAAPEPRCIAMPCEPKSVRIIKEFFDKDVALYIPPTDVTTDDVLGRFAACVRQYYPEATHVLRLTGDCPMLTRADVETFLHLVIPMEDTIYTNRPWDMDGYDMELFSVDMLNWADRHATDPYDREHVCSMMYRVFSVERLSVFGNTPGEYPGKCSVDTREDYKRVKEIME